MSKTITMPDTEYSDDLKQATGNGVNLGRKQIMDAVDSILTGKADKVIMNENLETPIVDFVNRVRVHAGLDVIEVSKPEAIVTEDATDDL